jgi:ectoine hydroxylase-related dioxygenase (phytanoyl-CoA dioxygenase family)
MTAFSSPQLTSDQVAQYEREGYTLVKQPLFAPEKFARLQAIFEENLTREGSGGMDMIHTRDARLLEFLLSDEVLDLIEPVIGPNIGLWASHFISKDPHTGKATPWHEDSAYWNGQVSTMERICTVWLAIDEATRENGCMAVIPSSQHGGFSDYEAVADANGNIFPTQIKADQVDDSKAVYFKLQPDECSLHEARLIHGAQANTSDKRRAGYTLRYFPTTSKVHAVNHPLWLARGVDLAGNTYQNA